MRHWVELCESALIESSRHCNNECPHIRFPGKSTPEDMTSQDVKAFCHIFEKDLSWDRKKKYNGYKRCKECRESERVE
jgi:hypothetical protein